jgi:hypothetical protein
MASLEKKWYHKTSMIIVAFLCVGPIALPLVWVHPQYSLPKKVIGTVLMVGATWWLYLVMKDSMGRIMAQYNELKSVMGTF